MICPNYHKCLPHPSSIFDTHVATKTMGNIKGADLRCLRCWISLPAVIVESGSVNSDACWISPVEPGGLCSTCLTDRGFLDATLANHWFCSREEAGLIILFTTTILNHHWISETACS